MKKDRDWVDYLNLAANLTQAGQLANLSDQARRQERLQKAQLEQQRKAGERDSAYRERALFQSLYRERVLTFDRAISLARKRLVARPQLELFVMRRLMDNFYSQGICSENFDSFTDKERVEALRNWIANRVERLESQCSDEQVTAVKSVLYFLNNGRHEPCEPQSGKAELSNAKTLAIELALAQRRSFEYSEELARTEENTMQKRFALSESTNELASTVATMPKADWTQRTFWSASERDAARSAEDRKHACEVRHATIESEIKRLEKRIESLSDMLQQCHQALDQERLAQNDSYNLLMICFADSYSVDLPSGIKFLCFDDVVAPLEELIQQNQKLADEWTAETRFIWQMLPGI